MKLEEYLHELNKVKILEPEEEALLWQQYRQKEDMAARRRLIEAYQPLVFKLAMPYRSMECIMDIIQEGTVGLIEAAETYQPEKAVAFSFYAAYRIRGRIINFLKQEGRADVAILDPPRAGCDERLLEAVVKAEPEKIVYVSCDPATLARDIKWLGEHGYEFREATPCDMFPWTSHVEVVTCLQRVNS